MSIKIKKFQTNKTKLKEWTKEDFLMSLAMHVSDVQKGCVFIANKIIEAGINHDYTKISLIDDFMEDNAKLAGVEFKAGKWARAHYSTERHHLNDKCPDDVTLIDIIEMLVDCTMASMSRIGQPTGVIVSDEILQKAFKNTIEMLNKEIIFEND